MRNFEGKDLLFIDKMITPTIINIIYWLLCVIVIVMGIVSLFANPLMILIIPFGLLYVRIMCEMFVVMFKINSNIERIAHIAEGKSANEE